MWKGSISFGLVNIPVQLYPAEETKELSFHLIDKRDLSPIKQERVSEKSGKQVPWEDIVKGYEYEEDRYVILTEDEIRKAYAKTTQTLDIVAFVKTEEIDPIYCGKPYYLEPPVSSRKAYEILRRTLADTEQSAIAKVVLRTRQHMAALIPHDRYIIASMLRFAHELRRPSFLDIPDAKKLDISEQELAMAKQLVGAMSQPWKPEQYKDEYHEQVMDLIKTKAETGEIKVIEEAPPPAMAEVVDIAALLKQSISRAKTEKKTASRQRA